jgi:sodium transport system permease protein
VTGGCCLLALRWAVDQFNTESVLFREGERLNLGLWLKHLRRDREATPSVWQAIFCGVLILMVRFAMEFALAGQVHSLLTIVAVTQLVVILTPALLMAVMLTTSPAHTLLVRWPRPKVLLIAVALGISLHPLSMALTAAVQKLYPMNPVIAEAARQMFAQTPWLALLLSVAVLVPICEELAFRGFILSGLRRGGRRWRAIVTASIFFAMTHAVFQQSLVAFVMGLLLGYLAVQSGSLLPCMALHAVHNGLAVVMDRLGSQGAVPTWLQWEWSEGRINWPLMAASALVSALLIARLRGQPYDRTAEEVITEAIDRQTAASAAG